MRAGPDILIAVDGSPEAWGALQVGVELAAARGVEVTLLHVNPTAAAVAYDEDPIRAPSEARILELDPVLRGAAEHARAYGVVANVKLVGGSDEQASTADVVSAVEGVATSRRVGLVVVGSRGHGPLSSAILGSVSNNLLKDSDRPVLVVRDPAKPQ